MSLEVFPIAYGGRQVLGVGKVRIEYRMVNTTADGPPGLVEERVEDMEQDGQQEEGQEKEQERKESVEEADFIKWRLDCIVCRNKPCTKPGPSVEGVKEEVEDWDVILGKGAMWV